MLHCGVWPKSPSRGFAHFLHQHVFSTGVPIWAKSPQPHCLLLRGEPILAGSIYALVERELWSFPVNTDRRQLTESRLRRQEPSARRVGSTWCLSGASAGRHGFRASSVQAVRVFALSQLHNNSYKVLGWLQLRIGVFIKQLILILDFTNETSIFFLLHIQLRIQEDQALRCWQFQYKNNMPRRIWAHFPSIF